MSIFVQKLLETELLGQSICTLLIFLGIMKLPSEIILIHMPKCDNAFSSKPLPLPYVIKYFHLPQSDI